MPTDSAALWKKLALPRPRGAGNLAAPVLSGPPIAIEFRSRITSHAGRLESGTGRGTPVHAAGFLRDRRIVLDEELLRRPRELERILIHELFHFVWLRAGNPSRREFEQIVRHEAGERVRGELGWSAEWRKAELAPRDSRLRGPRWREYVCESFCDTAAWLLTSGSHPEFTLALGHRLRRARWLRDFLRARPIPI